METPALRKGIFVSYSHRDKAWLERVQTFIKGAFFDEPIDAWDDTRIRPGQDWAKEIEAAMAAARVTILLVSPNFLASDFIRRQEMRQALDAQAKGSAVVFWIPISSSPFEQTPLRNVQAASDPRQPLDTLSEAQQNVILTKITNQVVAAMNVNRVANAFAVADEFAWQAEAVARGDRAATRPTHSVQADQVGTTVVLRRGGSQYETITAADMDKLDDNAQQLIRSWEAAMQELFDRWTETWPKRYAKDAKVCQRAESELVGIKPKLCEVLNHILGFVESMGKELDDHYLHVRYICSQTGL
jgi:hypothetical protein